MINLARNLFLLKHCDPACSRIYYNGSVLRCGTVYGSCYDFFLFIFILFDKHSALRFADSLNYHLFCGLCADTAEFFQRQLGFANSSENVSCIDFFCIFNRDLQIGVFNCFDNIPQFENLDVLFIGVYNHPYVSVAVFFSFICVCKRSFHALQYHFGRNTFLLSKHIKSFEKFNIHFRYLLSSGSNRQDFSPFIRMK